MAKPAYMTSGVDASLVRLIKDGALFLREVGADAPTGTGWTPGVGDEQVGYYSEDGFTITPVPGDETVINAHNGDPVVAEAAPGYWTVGFSGIEGNDTVTAAYFDVDVDNDGAVTVSSASASRRYDLVVVGLDQNDNVILGHFPNVQIDNSSREGLTFNRTTLLAYALQFRTFKGGVGAPYHFKAWGFSSEGAAKQWELEITGTPTGGTFKIAVNGVETSDIAYNADNSAIQTAINGISGVSGVEVSGTTTKTITFPSKVRVSADGSSLTGGTTPDVVVAIA